MKCPLSVYSLYLKREILVVLMTLDKTRISQKSVLNVVFLCSLIWTLFILVHTNLFLLVV